MPGGKHLGVAQNPAWSAACSGELFSFPPVPSCPPPAASQHPPGSGPKPSGAHSGPEAQGCSGGSQRKLAAKVREAEGIWGLVSEAWGIRTWKECFCQEITWLIQSCLQAFAHARPLSLPRTPFPFLTLQIPPCLPVLVCVPVLPGDLSGSHNTEF